MILQYTGLKHLTEMEAAVVKNFSVEASEKLDRNIKNGVLTIIAKEYQKSKNSKSVKYTLHARIEAPKLMFTARASDWDLNATLQELFHKFEEEIEHKLKPEITKKRQTRLNLFNVFKNKR